MYKKKGDAAFSKMKVWGTRGGEGVRQATAEREHGKKKGEAPFSR
jgi:hypothetical protein